MTMTGHFITEDREVAAPRVTPPPPAEAPFRCRVVVGIDGTPASHSALRWAAAEARARGAVLDVVSVWSYPPTSAAYSGYLPFAQWQNESVAATEEEVTAVLGEHLGLEVRATASMGPPARVLFDAAQGAELLVVGTSTRSGIRSTLGTAIDFASFHEAPCPLVVVPLHAEHAADERRPLYL